MKYIVALNYRDFKQTCQEFNLPADTVFLTSPMDVRGIKFKEGDVYYTKARREVNPSNEAEWQKRHNLDEAIRLNTIKGK